MQILLRRGPDVPNRVARPSTPINAAKCFNLSGSRISNGIHDCPFYATADLRLHILPEVVLHPQCLQLVGYRQSRIIMISISAAICIMIRKKNYDCCIRFPVVFSFTMCSKMIPSYHEHPNELVPTDNIRMDLLSSSTFPFEKTSSSLCGLTKSARVQSPERGSPFRGVVMNGREDVFSQYSIQVLSSIA